LAELRRKHPAARAVLEDRGLILGDQEDEVALRDAAVTLLENADGIADQARTAAFRRLNVARRIEFVGSVVSVASSAGVVSALLDLFNSEAALPLALVGFFAGALPLVAGWLRTSVDGASVAEALTGLREVVWQAQTLRGQLARGEDVDALVETVNALARTMADHLETLGYPGAVKPL
jgi:hypothetical protein